MKRLCIYPSDIRIITGKSERYARNLISKIKVSLNKQSHQYITFCEFCQFTGISITEVEMLLNT